MLALRTILILTALSMSLVISALAQTGVEKAKTENKGNPEYKFISTSKTSTFENELNAAAKQGYRLLRLAKTATAAGVAGLVMREQVDAAILYEYKLLAASRFSAFKKEFEEAVTQGFELRGLSSRGNLVSLFSLPELIAMMERPAGATGQRFAYRLLSVKGEKEKQQELDAAVSEGFKPIDMNLGLIVLSRKPDDSRADIGAREYRYLETTKVSTMEKEMNRLAEEGFQFHLGSYGSYAIMSRTVAAKTRKYEYKLLSTLRTGTMQRELEEIARQGYIYCTTSNGLGGMAAVMERSLSGEGGSRRYEYKFLATSREETTQKELNEALAAGYQFLDLATINEQVILLGRAAQADAKPSESSRN
jgi:hypothetical protein